MTRRTNVAAVGFAVEVRRVTLVCLLTSVGLASAATTGQIVGEVRDHHDQGLPGVRVDLASDALIGGKKTALTDDQGRFHFMLLPVGDYSVRAEADGYNPEETEMRVRLDRAASVGFRLVPVAFSGETVVSTEVPVVDTSQVSTNVVLGERWLQEATVGAERRSFLAAMRQAPGVAGTSVFGSTGGDNTYLIDGMNTSDPAQGISGTVVNFDSIEEMSVQTGGFEAKFGLATGGAVNLVTKSGGNNLSGSFLARYGGRGLTESSSNASTGESSLSMASATVGGAILPDRLWFFCAADWSKDSVQFSGDRFPRRSESGGWLGKLTWQTRPDLRATFFAAASPADVVGVNAGATVNPSASATLTIDKKVWWAQASWMPSDNAIIGLQVGTHESGFEPSPSHGDFDRVQHVNNDTDIVSNSSGLVWGDQRRRDELRLTGNVFVNDLGGSHEFEAGVIGSDLSLGYNFWFTGGAVAFDNAEPPGRDYTDLNGDGYFNEYLILIEDVVDPRSFLESDGVIFSAYVQDTWRPSPRLTVKPGLRFDAVRHDNHTGDRIADMRRWQPRLGVAWDLLGNARHVLRASVGRFMDPSALSLAGFTSFDRTITEYTTLEWYCNATYGLVCEPDSLPSWFPTRWFVSGEGVEYYLIDNRASGAYRWQTVDQLGVEELRAPYADQIVVGWETRLADDASLELSWVSKRTRDLLEDTCGSNTWAWDDGAPPSVDDPSTWTPLVGCDVKALANIPGLERDYEALIARIEARGARFHALASYTLSTSEGTSEAGPIWYADDNADFFPSGFVNWRGSLSDHRRHRLKINGYLLLPRRWTAAVNAFWSSAGHLAVAASCEELAGALRNPNGEARLDELGVDQEISSLCYSGEGVRLDSQEVLLLPRGSFATDDVLQVDLQVSKSFEVFGTQVTGSLAVLNVFDNQPGRTFNDRAFRQATDEDDNPVFDGEGHPVYEPVGAPLDTWLPRRWELGVRVEF